MRDIVVAVKIKRMWLFRLYVKLQIIRVKLASLIAGSAIAIEVDVEQIAQRATKFIKKEVKEKKDV